MSYLPEKLDEIEAKIKRLIHENKRLAASNTQLVEENKQLKFRLEETQASNGIQVISAGLTADTRKESAAINVAQLKEKIDKYTVEVEECIEWLSKE